MENPRSDSRPLLSQGAEVVEGGVRYRTWCKHQKVSVRIVAADGRTMRTIPLEPEGGGYFSAVDEQGKAGDRYAYQFDDEKAWPDPASRAQPSGVHEPSMVIDPQRFRWSDGQWKCLPVPELVIYELHLGTFTPEGTFRSAIKRLPHLARLGVTAVELMPIADFPGERNWGYDGVMLYAPARAYGTPDDLRAFVDAAHRAGLAVILDVVYNHLGPDGNYTGVYHDRYTNPELHTPWGAAFNYAEPAVRAFFLENAPYWMREFHIDGFRLDATHEIADRSEPHLLTEIATGVHALGGFVIAEDERNEPRLLLQKSEGGSGLDAAWADDFHHVVRVMLTGVSEGYYANYRGTVDELVQTITGGWLFRGQKQITTGEPRGGDPAPVAPHQFIYCISNHDQVGNRAFGERLSHIIDAAAYRAASALLCLVPETPMLFMGQEWAASSPFQFFTDHEAALGVLVTQGRRKEFRNFAAFRDPKLLQKIPDPQATTTFEDSKLRWEEIAAAPHSAVLQLYREFLALRRAHPAFRNRARDRWLVTELEEGIVLLVFKAENGGSLGVFIDLVGGHAAPAALAEWQPLLSSNETRFGGQGAEPFTVPTVLALERAS